MNKIMKCLRGILYNVVGFLILQFNKITFNMQMNKKKLIIFDTSIGTDNLGDFIIMNYCKKSIKELFGNCKIKKISTHVIPSRKEEKNILKAKYKFVCGTNLLTSHIEEWWNWRLPDGFRNKLSYRNVILFGVGWDSYQDKPSMYTKFIYRIMLNPSIIHSVRDQYSENMLKKAGIKNVVNTGCPTMWRLTSDFCKDIPNMKATEVVTTITDYRRDVDSDNIMLKVLSKNYEKVYLWIQGKNDREYLSKLNIPENLEIIPEDLKEYEKILVCKNVDYVGTRLHAGIFALNHKVRSIIIAVDNRAIEIAKDTNLPIILREDIKILEEKINLNFQIEINLPTPNIELFKNQFLN